MKYLLTVIFLLFISSTALSCYSSSDCSIGQCCIMPGIFGHCASHVSTRGARCGGKFHCSCQLPLICSPHDGSFWNRVLPGTGTCKLVGVA